MATRRTAKARQEKGVAAGARAQQTTKLQIVGFLAATTPFGSSQWTGMKSGVCRALAGQTPTGGRLWTMGEAPSGPANILVRSFA